MQERVSGVQELVGERPKNPWEDDPYKKEYPFEYFKYEVDRKEKIATVTLNNGDIRARVIQEAQNSGIVVDPLLINIDCSTPSCNHGTDSVIVAVTYNFPLLFNSIIGTGFDMAHSTEMKIPW